MIPRQNVTQKDLIDLESFLLSGKTPDNCMDIISLHGYFTSLAIGPETVMPSDWLPEIWGDELIWESQEEAENIFGLIMGWFNSIAHVLTHSPEKFKLLVTPSIQVNNHQILLENWCTGFMAGVDLTFSAWEAMLTSDDSKEILAPIILFGTDHGRKTLEQVPEASHMKFEHWVDLMERTVATVHSYWLPYRKSVHESTHKVVSNKVGRNDPCPCGSGKKFKHCCMN